MNGLGSPFLVDEFHICIGFGIIAKTAVAYAAYVTELWHFATLTYIKPHALGFLQSTSRNTAPITANSVSINKGSLCESKQNISQTDGLLVKSQELIKRKNLDIFRPNNCWPIWSREMLRNITTHSSWLMLCSPQIIHVNVNCESHKMRVSALFGAKQSRRPHASPRERVGHVDNSNCMKEGWPSNDALPLRGSLF